MIMYAFWKSSLYQHAKYIHYEDQNGLLIHSGDVEASDQIIAYYENYDGGVRVVVSK